jgi:glutathione peroxidase
VLEFATSKYDVTFPMFSKIEVNGDGACDLYQWLRAETGGGDITWNFEKFLIGRDGEIIERLSPMVTPEEIEPKLADLL